jgi:HEPN domain-containing protein
MQNRSLVKDYIERAGHRIAALDTLYDRGAWADVVRESQEVVELALKALLRSASIEPPRIHDVSEILSKNKELFSLEVQKDLKRMSEISRSLRRDRELAFYGSEDLTPSEFYKKEDADQARADARWLVESLTKDLF